jgi:hypothetical protein
MQIKVLTTVFAAVLVTVFLATLHIANADSFLSSPPFQLNLKQDAMKSMITDGLLLANQSSQQWGQKQHNESDQQEQPLTSNGLNSHNKFDNHSPSVISELPF